MLELVNRSGFCTVADLSLELGVSRMTVRRDIQQLEEGRKVRSAHGGVAALVPAMSDAEPLSRSPEQAAAERAVAARAVTLLEARSGATIGIDAGTSGLEVARVLYPSESLRVLTQSLPVMIELAGRPNLELVGIGGVLNAENRSFAGPGTTAALERFRLETLMLTVGSVRDGAMYASNAFDVETKRELIRIAERVVLIADSSKFEKVAPFDIAPLSAVDVAVVDSGIAAGGLAALEAAGVEAVIAPLPKDL